MKTTTRGESPLSVTPCSPSYYARRRLAEASAAFLAVGVIIGCAASSFGDTARVWAYVIAALWVMIAFWRIVRLNDLENSVINPPVPS